MSRLALLTSLLAALVLAGCGADDEVAPPGPPPAEEPVPTEPTAPAEELAQRCENEEAGFAVAYPGHWHTNSGDVAPACSFFDPEPFEVPEATEAVGVAAIHVYRDPVAFDVVTGEVMGIEILAREEIEVAGRPAVRRETEATGEGLLDAGTRAVEYVVDLGGGETLFASSHDVHGAGFAERVEVLDRMMETLELRS